MCIPLYQYPTGSLQGILGLQRLFSNGFWIALLLLLVSHNFGPTWPTLQFYKLPVLMKKPRPSLPALPELGFANWVESS